MSHILTDAEKASMFEALGDLAPVFQGKIPAVCVAAWRHGLLETVNELMRAAFLTDDTISDNRVKEAICAAAQFHCVNNYCLVWHSYSLLQLGFSMEEVRTFGDHMRLPDSVPESDKWSQVVRATYFRFQPNYEPDQSFRVLRSLLSDEEYHHYSRIGAYCYMLKFLQEAFFPQVQVEFEERYRDQGGALVPELDELVTYWQETKRAQAAAELEQRAPVMTMCLSCKDIRSRDGEWLPIEAAIQHFQANTLFSHGMCPPCKEKWRAEVAA